MSGVRKRTYVHECRMCECEFESTLKEHKYCGKRCRDKFRKKSGELARPKMGHNIPLKERKCLKCRQRFRSWGAGNRMCADCRRNPDRELGRE